MDDSKTIQEMAESIMIPIDELDISVRTYNCLKDEQIELMGDLIQRSEASLLKLRNFGRKCLNETVESLQYYNLSLGMQITKWRTKSFTEIVNALNEQKKLGTYKNGQKENEIIPVHLRKIEDLHLSVRSYNCLKDEQIELIGDLIQRSEASLLKIKNFGRKSLLEIKEKLTELNLTLGMTIKDWADIDSNDFQKNHKELINKDKEKQKYKTIQFFKENFEFLEDELYYIANLLSKTNRNADIAMKYFGWTGNPPGTLESVGNQFDLTRERIRQIINKFNRRLHSNLNNKIYFYKFEQCLNILRKRIPDKASLIEQELLEKKLVRSIFRIESIIKYLQEIYKEHQLYIIKINKTNLL